MSVEDGKIAVVSLKEFFRTELNGQTTRSGEAPYDPPPYAQTVAFRNRVRDTVQAFSIDDMHLFVVNDIPAGLEAIASSRMPLSDIPKFYETVKAIRNERRTRVANNRFDLDVLGDLEKSNEDGQIPEQSLDDARLMVAEKLSYIVAFNEELLGQNEAGVTPTAVYNRVAHEEKVIGDVENAAAVLNIAPKLFGQRTQSIYEGLTGRLNRHRGMFAGYRVNNKEFPPFPQPKPAK